MSYVVIDLETTGLSKSCHKITEIAAVRLDNGKITQEFQTFINPQCRIPPFITKLTGITDDMVQDAPTIQAVMPAIIKFFGNSVIVAHNATFDYGFLNYNALYYYNKKIANETLCTKKLANRLVPHLPNKKLATLCEHFNIVNTQAHRAMADVHATVEVFNNFSQLLKTQNIISPEQILTFEQSPARKNNIVYPVKYQI